MITELLHLAEALAAAIIAVTLRGVFLLICPYRPCRWCRPGGFIGGSILGRAAGHEAAARNRAGCRRCRGVRRTRRLGAKTAHRVKLVLAEAWTEWRYGE